MDRRKSTSETQWTLRVGELLLKLCLALSFLVAYTPAYAIERIQGPWSPADRVKPIKPFSPNVLDSLRSSARGSLPLGNSQRLQQCVDAVKEMTGVDTSARFLFDGNALINAQLGIMDLPNSSIDVASWYVPHINLYEIRSQLAEPLFLPFESSPSTIRFFEAFKTASGGLTAICAKGVDTRVSEIICRASALFSDLASWKPARLAPGRPLLDLSLNGVLAAGAFEALINGDPELIAGDLTEGVRLSHGLARSLSLLLFADRSSVSCQSNGDLTYGAGHEFAYFLWKLDRPSADGNLFGSMFAGSSIITAAPWLSSISPWSYIGALNAMDVAEEYSRAYARAERRAISKLMQNPLFQDLFIGTQSSRLFSAWEPLRELRKFLVGFSKPVNSREVSTLLTRIRRSTSQPELIRPLLVLVDIAEEARAVLAAPTARQEIDGLMKGQEAPFSRAGDPIYDLMSRHERAVEEMLVKSAVDAMELVQSKAVNGGSVK